MCDIEILQCFEEYILSPLNISTLKKFVKTFDCEINVLSSIETSDVPNLILLNIGNNCLLKQKDINWLRPVENAIILNLSDDTTVVAMEINCDKEDYPLFAAAYVRLFELANFSSAIFILKVDDSISFACKKQRINKKNIDFAITKLFDNDNSSEIVELINELSTSEHSDYEDVLAYYGRPLFVKNVDTDDEELMNLTNIISFTDEDIVELLGSLGEKSDKSSYELLISAEEDFEKAQKFMQDDASSELLEDGLLSNISEEAFGDAELLLKELMGN